MSRLVKVVDRRPYGANEDLCYIDCNGTVYREVYDARFFNDQIENLFRKDVLHEKTICKPTNEQSDTERDCSRTQ